jgi:hypothetical protein
MHAESKEANKKIIIILWTSRVSEWKREREREKMAAISKKIKIKT